MSEQYKYVDEKEADEAFVKASPHLWYPSNDLSWEQIRKISPDLEYMFGQKGINFNESKFGTRILQWEREVGLALFVKEKYGADVMNLAGEAPITESIKHAADTLKEKYKEFGMYHGETAFDVQVGRIESSVRNYVLSLGK